MLDNSLASKVNLMKKNAEPEKTNNMVEAKILGKRRAYNGAETVEDEGKIRSYIQCRC